MQDNALIRQKPYITDKRISYVFYNVVCVIKTYDFHKFGLCLITRATFVPSKLWTQVKQCFTGVLRDWSGPSKFSSSLPKYRKTLFATTIKIHLNLASRPSRYSDELVTVSQNPFAVSKVKSKKPRVGNEQTLYFFRRLQCFIWSLYCTTSREADELL